MWSRNSRNRFVRVEDLSISSYKSTPVLLMEGTHVEDVRTPPLEAIENPKMNIQENVQQNHQGNFGMNRNLLEQQLLNQQNLNQQQNFQGIHQNANFNAQGNFQGNYQNRNFNGQQFADPPPNYQQQFFGQQIPGGILSKRRE